MTKVYTNGMSNEQLFDEAPSIFAKEPWQGMSERYAYVPTIAVVDRMRDNGFLPVRAEQSRTRIPGKGDFTKHMIRFRQVGATLQLGGVFPEIVLVNSHDGTSTYAVDAGLFRLICMNGMVTPLGSLGGSVRVKHIGDIAGQVIDATYSIVEEFPAIVGKAETFRQIELSREEQRAFAESALSLRWDEGHAPIDPEQALTIRRSDDREPNLWNVFNRVQENLMKGGIRGRSQTGRRMRTRRINSVTEDVKLNKALWALTCKMEELAGK